MTFMRRCLMLPMDFGDFIVIMAEDGYPCSLLERLAELLSLSLFPYENALFQSSITLSASVPSGAIPLDCNRRIFRYPDRNSWFIRVPVNGYQSNESICGCLMRTLHLALIQQTLADKGVVMHGALLSHPGSETGIALFGQSGVGKSSAARRFSEQGGDVLSDDRLFISFGENGEIFARPLPTWSRFAEHPAVNFNYRIPLKGLFMLFRGEDDTIVRPVDSNWSIWLHQSLAATLYNPPGWLSITFIRDIMVHAMEQASLLKKHFGQWQLNGALNGHIYDNITSFLRFSKS